MCYYIVVPHRIKLAIIAGLLVLGLCCALISLISLWHEDAALGRKLDKIERAYSDLQDKYLSIKKDTRRLQNDAEYQKEILKNEFGYVEKNEVPVIVVDPKESDETK